MRDLAVLFLHLLATAARLAGPGGARSVLAESVLVKQQVLILNRSRRRSPNLRPADRMVAGLCALLMRPCRLIRSAIVMKPSTFLTLHRALTKRKYRWLFSSGVPKKPGPKSPTQDVIAAVVDMKQRNPTWGCPRIAQQIALAFGIPIDKDVVRRILAVHHQPEPDSCGPSWLTFLGHAKDSLWSIDMFRCESAILRSHWVLLVMDQCTRRIVGFGIHAGIVDGLVLHVQPCHSRACDAEVPQFRQRSAVPVPPMVGQPAGAVCDRGQECSLCSDVASVCRAVDRHCATRMLGSDVVLVRAGPGTETVRISGLLQCSSGTCVVGRTDASPATEGCRNAQPLPMGRALPRTLSDADRRLKSEGEDAGWWLDSPLLDVPRVTAIAKPTRTLQQHILRPPSRPCRG